MARTVIDKCLLSASQLFVCYFLQSGDSSVISCYDIIRVGIATNAIQNNTYPLSFSVEDTTILGHICKSEWITIIRLQYGREHVCSMHRHLNKRQTFADLIYAWIDSLSEPYEFGSFTTWSWITIRNSDGLYSFHSICLTHATFFSELTRSCADSLISIALLCSLKISIMNKL